MSTDTEQGEGGEGRGRWGGREGGGGERATQ